VRPVELYTPACGRYVVLCLYVLCFVSPGLIYKAYTHDLVHFAGKTLSVSFQKFIVLMGLTLWGLRALQVVLEQGSATLGCDLSHAFHIAV